jgi:hypothetical protein
MSYDTVTSLNNHTFSLPFTADALCFLFSHSGNLTSMMTQGRIQPDEMCVGAMYKQFRQVQLSTSLCELANIFDR